MNQLITVIGTTASGKSDLGLFLAETFRGEIISADSRQIYRHLDLGTGKETPEELARVPHHMIDIRDVNEPFSLGEYQPLAYEAIDSVIAQNKPPFLVGGTGLYTRAIVEGYQLADIPPDESFRAEMANKTKEELLALLKEEGVVVEDDSASERRLIRQLEKIRGGEKTAAENKPRYETLQLGLTFDRAVLNKRIEERLDRRLQCGMLDEARHLLEIGATPEFLLGLGLEYRFMYQYITGEFHDYTEFREKLLIAICQFAKRQSTWFRKEKNVIWLDVNGDFYRQAKELTERFLNQ